MDAVSHVHDHAGIEQPPLECFLHENIHGRGCAAGVPKDLAANGQRGASRDCEEGAVLRAGASLGAVGKGQEKNS